MNDDNHDSDDGDDDDNDHDHTDSYRESSWTSPSLRAPQMGIGSQRTHSWLQKCCCRSPRSAHIDALYEMTQHKEICNILGASSEDSEEQRKARTRSPRVHRRSPGQDRVWEEERRPPNSWMEKPRTAAAVLTWVYLELHSPDWECRGWGSRGLGVLSADPTARHIRNNVWRNCLAATVCAPLLGRTPRARSA